MAFSIKKYITVEPVIFLYIFAYMLTTVAEQDLYLHRACVVNHKYSTETCAELKKNSTIEAAVQITTAWFHQWNGIANCLVPVILSVFLGPYSDKRGRKGIILAGLIGKLYFSAALGVYMLTLWPVEYVIAVATLPSALTGADLAIFSGCFSYVADVSTTRERTMRITILNAVYVFTMPVGVAFGHFLYQGPLKQSYMSLFSINSSIMLLATMYAAFFLKWRTAPQQQSRREESEAATNLLSDFFRWDRVLAVVKTLTMPRPDSRRAILWSLLIGMGLYTFQRAECPFLFIYCVKTLGWDISDFSHFKTFLNAGFVIAMLIIALTFSKYLNVRDQRLAIMGVASHIVGHTFFAAARGGLFMYLGALASAGGPCVLPMIRAMASKVVPAEERGVVYAALSVMENLTAMIASATYAQIYSLFVAQSYPPNSMFIFTIISQVFLFIALMVIDLQLAGRRVEDLRGDCRSNSLM